MIPKPHRPGTVPNDDCHARGWPSATSVFQRAAEVAAAFADFARACGDLPTYVPPAGDRLDDAVTAHGAAKYLEQVAWLRVRIEAELHGLDALPSVIDEAPAQGGAS